MTAPEIIPIIIMSAAGGSMLILGIWYSSIKRKERKEESERLQERTREYELKTRMHESSISYLKSRLYELEKWKSHEQRMRMHEMSQWGNDMLKKGCYDEGKGDEK